MIEWVILGVLSLVAIGTLINMRKKVTVPQGHVGLRYINEAFSEQIEPGVYRRFDPFGEHRIVIISTRPTALMPHQVEVTSKDQFAFRVTLSPLVTVSDAQAYDAGNPIDAGYYAELGDEPMARLTRVIPVLSDATIAAVASRTLEEFLADPKAMLEEIKPAIEAVMPGVTLDDVVISAITMPPEIRKMFTEVERARREGLASLERAKAEQASLRALANAARNMNGNPQLAQLRTLQVMESSKGPKTFVIGETGQASQMTDSGDKSA